MANNKYEILRARHPQFERTFLRRVSRGDTDQDLAFWIRSHYQVKVSDESIRQWRLRLTNGQ